MKKKLAVILSFVLVFSLIATTISFGENEKMLSEKPTAISQVEERSGGLISNIIAEIREQISNNLFNRIKKKTDSLITEKTYTKSEIDKLIEGLKELIGKNSGCDCSVPTKLEDIKVFPEDSFMFKYTPFNDAHADQSIKNTNPDIEFNKIELSDLKENNYNDWLSSDDKIKDDRYWYRYEFKINFSGTIDSKYAGLILEVDFGEGGYKETEIKNDGTFTGTRICKCYELPKEVRVVSCELFTDYE